MGYQVPESPFQDLPEALVEEMLSQYKHLGEKLSQSFEEVQQSRTASLPGGQGMHVNPDVSGSKGMLEM